MGNLWFVSSKSSYSRELKKETAVSAFKRRAVGTHHSDALSAAWLLEERRHAQRQHVSARQLLSLSLCTPSLTQTQGPGRHQDLITSGNKIGVKVVNTVCASTERRTAWRTGDLP